MLSMNHRQRVPGGGRFVVEFHALSYGRTVGDLISGNGLPSDELEDESRKWDVLAVP